MKPLLSSPCMRKTKYSAQKLFSKSFNAILYCVYVKSDVRGRITEENRYPTSYFLYVKSFGKIYEITDYLGCDFRRLAMTIDDSTKKEKKMAAFRKKVILTSDATDTDVCCEHKPYSFYPMHSYVKTLNVRVKFSGLDQYGEATWSIVI